MTFFCEIFPLNLSRTVSVQSFTTGEDEGGREEDEKKRAKRMKKRKKRLRRRDKKFSDKFVWRAVRSMS